MYFMYSFFFFFTCEAQRTFHLFCDTALKDGFLQHQLSINIALDTNITTNAAEEEKS